MTALAAWTEADEHRYHQLLKTEEDVESLSDYIIRVSPHHPPPRHYAPIVARIEGARRKPIRLAFSLPPRHAKTELIKHAIGWWMKLYPADLSAYTSYSDKQAWSKSAEAKRLVEVDLKMRGAPGLSRAMSNLAEWRTREGGGLLAGGVGGALTGKGVSGLMVVDDPLKNRLEAESQTIRDARWGWLTDVVMTRLEGASVIIILTRWHPDDMIGRIEKELADEFEVINIPALSEGEGDLLGRPIGAALWPDGPNQYDEPYLLKQKKIMGPYSFDSLYQGRPRSKGTRLFGPAHYYDPRTVDWNGCRPGCGADPAVSDDDAACYSAIVGGRFQGRAPETRTLYIREVYREQVLVPTFVNDLRAFQRRNDNCDAAVESDGVGKPVIQTLRAVDRKIRIKPSPTKGLDKFQRAQGVAAAWNDGRVLVPLGPPCACEGRLGRACEKCEGSGYEVVPWLKEFLDEVQRFTGVNDDYADQVDALAHLWNAGPARSLFD